MKARIARDPEKRGNEQRQQQQEQWPRGSAERGRAIEESLAEADQRRHDRRTQEEDTLSTCETIVAPADEDRGRSTRRQQDQINVWDRRGRVTRPLPVDDQEDRGLAERGKEALGTALSAARTWIVARSRAVLRPTTGGPNDRRLEKRIGESAA